MTTLPELENMALRAFRDGHQPHRHPRLAATDVGENPFHADGLKLLRRLRESEGRHRLMRAMHCKAVDRQRARATRIHRVGEDSYKNQNCSRASIVMIAATAIESKSFPASTATSPVAKSKREAAKVWLVNDKTNRNPSHDVGARWRWSL